MNRYINIKKKESLMITIAFSSLTTTNLGTLGNRTIEVSERIANQTVTTSPLLAEIKTKSEVYNAVVLKKYTAAWAKRWREPICFATAPI